MLRLFTWGTTVAFDKYSFNKRLSDAYWHHKAQNNFLQILRSTSIIMISSAFKTFSSLLFPKLLFLLTIITFLKNKQSIF